jgi:two-component system NtrC family response regulator
MIGQSTATCNLIKQIHQVANTDATVLILGESGTGKELTARAIHQLSDRRSNPFVGVNLGALPETLLESELFGHEKGSFTDARRQKMGHFEHAGEGTLFLDEITETPSKTQITLLRVLEEREFRRVGGEQVKPFKARVISATNQDFESLILEGKFREDLFYRLNVVPIHLPPLRDRKDDIPILVNHFLKHFCKKYQREQKQMSPQAMREIMDKPWPGNIRQLKNMMERLVVTVADLVIRQEDLPVEAVASRDISPTKLSTAVEEVEVQTISKALSQVGYHREKAANVLGISVRSLHYKMSRYGLH